MRIFEEGQEKQREEFQGWRSKVEEWASAEKHREGQKEEWWKRAVVEELDKVKAEMKGYVNQVLEQAQGGWVQRLGEMDTKVWELKEHMEKGGYGKGGGWDKGGGLI